MDEIFVFVFTKIASTEVFFVAMAVLLLFILKRDGRRSGLIFLGATIGLLASVVLIKELIQSPRPDGSLIPISGYAFPSGHATSVTFVAIVFSYFNRHDKPYFKNLIYALSVLAVIAVVISRIYFNVHTPLQVITGIMLGAFWALVWIDFKKR